MSICGSTARCRGSARNAPGRTRQPGQPSRNSPLAAQAPGSFTQALEHRPLVAYQLVVVGLVMLALVIDGLDYQLLALVAPVILAEWAVSRAEFGTAMAAALFGMALGAAGGGALGDRIGRLKALVLAVLLFGAATILASRSETVDQLAAWRVVGGLGFGAAGPNAIALASEWMPRRLRTQVVALLAVGTPAGGMLGALLLPSMLAGLGWRGVFVVLGFTAIALGLILALALRESPQWLLAKGHLEAAARSARRVLTEGPDPRASTPADTSATSEPRTAQASQTCEPASASEAAASPGPRPRLLAATHARLNLGLALGFAALTAIVYGLGAWMPSFLTAAGFTLDQALGASLAFNACSIAGALAAGWLVARYGSRRVLLASTVFTALLLVGFGLALDGLTLDGLTGASGLAGRAGLDLLAGSIGAAASIGVTTLYAMATLLYPAPIRSSGIGLGMTMGRVGGIAMSYAGGALLDLADGSALVLASVLAACALVASSAGWLIRRQVPPS